MYLLTFILIKIKTTHNKGNQHLDLTKSLSEAVSYFSKMTDAKLIKCMCLRKQSLYTRISLMKHYAYFIKSLKFVPRYLQTWKLAFIPWTQGSTAVCPIVSQNIHFVGTLHMLWQDV